MNPMATSATQPREMAATNLIRDGSFEKPKVPKGSYKTYNTGTTFGPWKVVRAPGDVALRLHFFKGARQRFHAQI